MVYFSKKAPNPGWLPNHATNNSYKNCSFCIINYFETSSIAINTPKYTISHPCVGICG